MNIDYKELLRRYVGTVRRYNVGEDFIDQLPIVDQRVIRSLVAPNTTMAAPHSLGGGHDCRPDRQSGSRCTIGEYCGQDADFL
jgi:hypothetical protein